MADISKPVAQLMVDVGFLDVILPFMLVFTILFAILQKTKVFGATKGEPKSNFNAMFAFVVAFFFIASLARVEILTAIVQKLAIVVVAATCVLLVTGLWGKEVGFLKYKWLLAVLFIVVLLIFGTSIGWFTLSDLGVIGEWVFHPITIMALAFIVVFWFIIKEPAKKVKEEKPKERPKEKPGEPPKEQPPGTSSSEFEPQLVREIPREELYGGEDRTIWKE